MLIKIIQCHIEFILYKNTENDILLLSITGLTDVTRFLCVLSQNGFIFPLAVIICILSKVPLSLSIIYKHL